MYVSRFVREPSSALLFASRSGKDPRRSGLVRSRSSTNDHEPRRQPWPPTTMPAIHHVAVTVTDLEVSEAWYTKVLGVAAGPRRGHRPVPPHRLPARQHAARAARLPGAGQQAAVQRAPARPRPHLVRLRQPRRARGVGRPPRRARHRPRRHRRRRLRLGTLVPRPRQHRPRALRSPRRLTEPDASETHTCVGLGRIQRAGLGVDASGRVGGQAWARARRQRSASRGWPARWNCSAANCMRSSAVAASPSASASAACASASAPSHEVPCHSSADSSALARRRRPFSRSPARDARDRRRAPTA